MKGRGCVRGGSRSKSRSRCRALRTWSYRDAKERSGGEEERKGVDKTSSQVHTHKHTYTYIHTQGWEVEKEEIK